MSCRKHATKDKSGTVPVYLNVYDLTSINGYAYWFGLGVYHSGVQVHGVEYAFGWHESTKTGIFEGQPKKCPGFTFRKSILIGTTDLSPKEVGCLMEKLAPDYAGNAYNVITKNCNHFCEDACLKLTGSPIPRWVNRLARLGFLCNCMLPSGFHKTSVTRRPEVTPFEGEKKWRSKSESVRSPFYLAEWAVQCSEGSEVTRKERWKLDSPNLYMDTGFGGFIGDDLDEWKRTSGAEWLLGIFK